MSSHYYFYSIERHWDETKTDKYHVALNQYITRKMFKFPPWHIDSFLSSSIKYSSNLYTETLSASWTDYQQYTNKNQTRLLDDLFGYIYFQFVQYLAKQVSLMTVATSDMLNVSTYMCAINIYRHHTCIRAKNSK